MDKQPQTRREKKKDQKEKSKGKGTYSGKHIRQQESKQKKDRS